MREVFLKDNSKNHRARVKGKDIQFKNGKAELDDDDADELILRDSNLYYEKTPLPKRKAKAKKEPANKTTKK